MADLSPRAQLLAELTGEVLTIVLGVVLVVALGWDEFGAMVVIVGTIGFVVTIVRAWKRRGQPAEPDAMAGGPPLA